MAPIQMSMLSGVPYRVRNFLAKSRFFSTRVSCSRFRGWESLQKRRQALYPAGEGQKQCQSYPCSLPAASTSPQFLLRDLCGQAILGRTRALVAAEALNLLKTKPLSNIQCEGTTMLSVHQIEECVLMQEAL